MIQFNLLPDVKKKFIRAKRIKHMILTSSLLVSAIAVFVVMSLFTLVQIGQRKNIDDLTRDIDKVASDIQSIEDLNEMLTVQNQLNLLPALHEQKPYTSRLFDYLSLLVPKQAPVSNLELDFSTQTISIRGQADSLATINKLVDTLKFATYSVKDDDARYSAFEVTSTRLEGDNTSAAYQIEMTFDPVIFDNSKDVAVTVNQSNQATQAATMSEEDQ